VERFLAVRQSATEDADRRGEVRRLLGGSAKVTDATLFGPKGAHLAAYDFKNAALKPSGAGRFTVPVYLLFANRDGSVLESRDELLTFQTQGGGYACTADAVTGTMAWDSDAVARAAQAQGLGDGFNRAAAFLRDWSGKERRNAVYSIADFEKTPDGRLRVPCLRYVARSGARGYEVVDAPLVLIGAGDGYRVESN
jgi:hypothetical protein